MKLELSLFFFLFCLVSSVSIAYSSFKKPSYPINSGKIITHPKQSQPKKPALNLKLPPVSNKSY